MGNHVWCLGLVLAVAAVAEGFYKPVTQKDMKTVTPKTNDELVKALCSKYSGGDCSDDAPVTIIIEKAFNFTGSEGTKTEKGCIQNKECLDKTQYKIDTLQQCNGLEETDVTFDVAGKKGLDVGSNKIIDGKNKGQLIGKGLVLKDVKNVEIRNLRIIDINKRVVWGGDAIDIQNSHNILIDGCYIKDIGRQFIVTHFGTNTGILVNNTIFDGESEFSSTCNGHHYWVWLFIGTGDQIVLQNNVIKGTSGRGPHLAAQKNSKIILHITQNTFFDVKGHLIDIGDPNSSVLVEGNVFYQVDDIEHNVQGHIFFPLSEDDAKKCHSVLGRDCLVNVVKDSKNTDATNSEDVLKDFEKLKESVPPTISMKDSMNSMKDLVKFPAEVEKIVT